MVTQLVGALGAAIGSRFLPGRNQLAFVEYARGAISLLDLVRGQGAVFTKGSMGLKQAGSFDCDTGTFFAATGGQIPPARRTPDFELHAGPGVRPVIEPINGAAIAEIGAVDWDQVTPELLQVLPYRQTPIPLPVSGPQLLPARVLVAVRTNRGYYAKVELSWSSPSQPPALPLAMRWITYSLASPYHPIGTGYQTPEDIAVMPDEQVAFVTERTGALLRVQLANANRAAAAPVADNLNAPQQIYLDPVRLQAYVVEYDSPNRLVRVDLNTCAQTVLLSGLDHPVGLLISADLAYAYISEQAAAGGRLVRYALNGAAPLVLATGLVNPFYLTWANPGQTAILVAERDPANRITMVDTVPYPGSVRQVITGTAARPSSVALRDATHVLICADQEIDEADLLAGSTTVQGLFKRIGLVPLHLIGGDGLAHTENETTYPYQFAAGSPFGGRLSLQVDHEAARQAGRAYYRALVDGVPRTDAWWDLELNPANGKYDIPVQTVPKVINNQPGYYPVREAGHRYVNGELGLIMDSTTLGTGLHNLVVEFTDAAGSVHEHQPASLYIDNQPCLASIDLPTLDGSAKTTPCGMLQFTDDKLKVTIAFVASHPETFATYGFSIVKGPGQIYWKTDKVAPPPPAFSDTVRHLLGSCPAAAFGVGLSVWAMAIDGYARQSQYDAWASIAFALTP